jgi:hypothetical protein
LFTNNVSFKTSINVYQNGSKNDLQGQIRRLRQALNYGPDGGLSKLSDTK